ITSSITIDFSMTATSGTLSVVANNGSGNSVPRTQAITVNAMASQPGSISGSNTATQGQNNVAYFVLAQSGVTFNWTYNGTGVTVVSGQGTEGVTINYSSTATSGDIEVTASSALCPSTSLPTSMTISVSPSTGIEDGQSNASYSMFVYPNPATSEAIVELNMKTTSHVNVTVYDILGHEVKVLIDQNLTSMTQAFSLDGLAYGVYFVKAKSGDEVVTVKLIKH
ncbi:MAG: T9SS type A sorting domain-containing protein, partial [Cytophagaceae bacterium]|nr:T9SS type A sorting domain-containing protein [Cytophagaceae bacterium]